MREKKGDGVQALAHGFLAFITFMSLTALGCGQIEYLRLKICEDYFSKGDVPTSGGVGGIWVVDSFGPRHHPAPALSTPSGLQAGNVTYSNCTRPDVSAKIAQVLQVVRIYIYICGRRAMFGF